MTTEDEERSERNKNNRKTSKVRVHSYDKTDHKEDNTGYHKETSMIEMIADNCKSQEKATKCKECHISKSDIPKEKKPKKEVDGDKKSCQLADNKYSTKDKADTCDISAYNSQHLKCKDRLGKHL